MLEKIKGAIRKSKLVKTFIYSQLMIFILSFISIGIWAFWKISVDDSFAGFLPKTQRYLLVGGILLTFFISTIIRFFFNAKFLFLGSFIQGSLPDLKLYIILSIVVLIALPIFVFFDVFDIIIAIIFFVAIVIDIIFFILRYREVKAKQSFGSINQQS